MTVKKQSRKSPKIAKNLRRDLITIIVWSMFRQEQLLISPMRNHRRRKSSMNYRIPHLGTSITIIILLIIAITKMKKIKKYIFSILL